MSPLLFKVAGVCCPSLFTFQSASNHTRCCFPSTLVLEHTTHPAQPPHQKAYCTTAPQDHTSASPNSSASVTGRQSDRRGNKAKKDALEEHSPGSERWNRWTGQLQLAGLSAEQAAAAITPAASLMNREPANTDEMFKRLVAKLLRDTGITAEQFKYLLMQAPDFLRVTSTDGVMENLKWFKTTLDVNTAEWMHIALLCRPLITLREESLRQRLDALTRIGLDAVAIRECWIQTPELVKLNPGVIPEKFASLHTLFSVSGAEVMKTSPWAMLFPIRDLQDRVRFLQRLNSETVTLADVHHGLANTEFAVQTVGAHLRATGQTLLQLCSKLQEQPGVREYLEKHNVDPALMTEFKYYLVDTFFARPAQHVSDGTVASTGKWFFECALLRL